MAVERSSGVTATEEWLAQLCEQTFFGLWSYPNPAKDDGDELCDLLAIYKNHVFIFFDRENTSLHRTDVEQNISWNRWKRKSIDAQIKTATGATRYLKSGRKIYVNEEKVSSVPVSENRSSLILHRIIVAHGAKEACLRSSSSNIYGSLGIFYGDEAAPEDTPFTLSLRRKEPVHVLDAVNLPVVLRELNTPHDFAMYIIEKERAISKYPALSYCGEEDLLAHYLLNYDKNEEKHYIGSLDTDYTFVAIEEGAWKGFVETDLYKRRQAANRRSYLWDEIIQHTSANALADRLIGPNSPLVDERSAIHEMVKEPRHFRRALSNQMTAAISSFPVSDSPFMRNISFMPSHDPERGYVFLQIKCDFDTGDFERDHRPKRVGLLEIACGVARNKFTHLKTVVGIAIDCPKFSDNYSDDQLLLDCSEWSLELEEEYREANADLKFFETDSLVRHEEHLAEFPGAVTKSAMDRAQKVGRNDRCPCGSGQKFKKCCYRKNE